MFAALLDGMRGYATQVSKPRRSGNLSPLAVV
jgi:hypothetical protein